MGMTAGGPEAQADLIDSCLARVRRAAVARFGFEIGVEAAAEATVWAWANRQQVEEADNPAGLLFRVAQTRAEPHVRWSRRRAPVDFVPESTMAAARPELIDLWRALPRLRTEERVAVVLVHAHGERYDDVADLLGITTAAVTNHVHRGLRKLRSMMEDTA
jgi:DNA-directed RNA polymerase specialized sigma24 family protein